MATPKIKLRKLSGEKCRSLFFTKFNPLLETREIFREKYWNTIKNFNTFLFYYYYYYYYFIFFFYSPLPTPPSKERSLVLSPVHLRFQNGGSRSPNSSGMENKGKLFAKELWRGSQFDISFDEKLVYSIVHPRAFIYNSREWNYLLFVDGGHYRWNPYRSGLLLLSGQSLSDCFSVWENWNFGKRIVYVYTSKTAGVDVHIYSWAEMPREPPLS